MKTRIKTIALTSAIVLLSLSIQRVNAQDLSVSTNLASWADLGTMNADLAYSVSRHWSVGAGMQYNPFSFTKSSGDIYQDMQQSYALSTRYWPWHVYSGWFLAGKAQYQEFNTGGISSPDTTEGDRYGTGLSAGYAKMLGSHLNMEFGLGMWMGRETYIKYACPVCGTVIGEGSKTFLLPDSLLLSLAYIF